MSLLPHVARIPRVSSSPPSCGATWPHSCWGVPWRTGLAASACWPAASPGSLQRRCCCQPRCHRPSRQRASRCRPCSWRAALWWVRCTCFGASASHLLHGERGRCAFCLSCVVSAWLTCSTVSVQLCLHGCAVAAQGHRHCTCVARSGIITHALMTCCRLGWGPVPHSPACGWPADVRSGNRPQLTDWLGQQPSLSAVFNEYLTFVLLLMPSGVARMPCW